MAAPKISNRIGVTPTAEDPEWYRDAIIYEVHVRAFFDSNGDGKGDFGGLTEKLDYLRDLGITAIWVLPFYPSPLRDDGYDIADYRSVHPAYGDLADFKVFVRAAHDRGMRVITELVLNHTSDQHPWFQRARRARKGSRWRNFYVWSDGTERYKEARVIFRDFEESNWAWDPLAGQYYWHRFYSHQPDLNFENAEVRRAMLGLVDYWLAMGVDGLRLDAVPYLFEEEGTSCENLPRTHAFLKDLRKHIDAKFPGRMLLAEANQWPEDAVEYFGQGDECHMAFHFPLMPRLFMAVRMEDRFPIQEIMDQTPAIPGGTQWALFLRNHDELTLEMVTDEERDYMYRVYARDPEMRINLGIRRRLAPLLENNRRQIELLTALMFSLPGTPVIYYGDEIGMGDNVYLGDRNGVRTPMQWSSDRNAGFSRANPQRLFLPLVTDPEYRHDAVNVETQQGNLHGLLWWTKRLIDIRRRWRSFGRGTFELVNSENRHVFAFIRKDGAEQVLVVANLSRFVQSAGLDLQCMAGVSPVELFGGAHFPTITETPYPISIGPHGFYWFSLTQPGVDLVAPAATITPSIATIDLEDEPQPGELPPALVRALRSYLPRARWFRSKAREPRKIEVVESIALRKRGEVVARFVVLRVDYREGEAERYVVPLAIVAAATVPEFTPTVIARVTGTAVPSLLVDATSLPDVGELMLDLIARRRTLEGANGDLVGVPYQRISAATAPPRDRGADQTNTSLIFGEQFMLKVFRKLEDGVNPEVEMTRALAGTKFTSFAHAAGSIEYRDARTGASSVAVLQAFVPHESTALDQTVDEIERFFDRVIASERTITNDPATARPTGDIAQLAGPFAESAAVLGRTTAEMHLALASLGPAGLAPEPFTPFVQRSIYQGLRGLAGETIRLLRQRLSSLNYADGALAADLLLRESVLRGRLRRILDSTFTGRMIRVHGDLHLGQILVSGRTFIIIDFEGEPARSLAARQLKRPALRDVAGLLRSFDYAAAMAMTGEASVSQRIEDLPLLAAWADQWVAWTSDVFLAGYLEAAAGGGFLPTSSEEQQLQLEMLLLEKALYELGYELNNRPEQAGIPLRALLRLIPPV